MPTSHIHLLHPKLVHFFAALFISAVGFEISFTLVIADFVTITGHNGGRMVYAYGVGVGE